MESSDLLLVNSLEHTLTRSHQDQLNTKTFLYKEPRIPGTFPYLFSSNPTLRK